MTKGKIIIIDGGVLTHIAIFQWGSMTKAKREGKMPQDAWIPNPDYTYFRMMISFLKKIVVKKHDKIIIAVDARHSWRRAFYPIYKGQRKEMRQSHEHIDWAYHYALIDEINEKLNNSTDWHFIKMSDFISFGELCKTEEGKRFDIASVVTESPNCRYGIEADDIQAVACKVFSDQEVILVTGDADLDQLAYFPNTKIFSTYVEADGQRGCYKIIEKPLKILADKIRKGDISDNILVNAKKDTEYDRNIRELIVNLVNMPSFIEKPITDILLNLEDKEIIYSNLPYQNSVGNFEKYNDIYLPDKMLSWEKAERLHKFRAKKKEKKRKEQYEKRKQREKAKKEKSLR